MNINLHQDNHIATGQERKIHMSDSKRKRVRVRVREGKSEIKMNGRKGETQSQVLVEPRDEILLLTECLHHPVVPTHQIPIKWVVCFGHLFKFYIK